MRQIFSRIRCRPSGCKIASILTPRRRPLLNRERYSILWQRAQELQRRQSQISYQCRCGCAKALRATRLRRGKSLLVYLAITDRTSYTRRTRAHEGCRRADNCSMEICGCCIGYGSWKRIYIGRDISVRWRSCSDYSMNLETLTPSSIFDCCFSRGLNSLSLSIFRLRYRWNITKAANIPEKGLTCWISRISKISYGTAHLLLFPSFNIRWKRRKVKWNTPQPSKGLTPISPFKIPISVQRRRN